MQQDKKTAQQEGFPVKRAVFVLIALWYLLAGVTSKPFLPYPHAVLIHFAHQVLNGDILLHFLTSTYRITLATVSAVIPAVSLGILAGRIHQADRFISPFAYVLYPIPKVALLPLIMLVFGLGNLSKIFLIALIIFFQLFFVIRDASRAIDTRYIDSVKSLGASRTGILVHVIIPAVLPSFFTALRVSTGTATAVLFLAETFATVNGLGYLILDSWARMNYLDMYAAMTGLTLLAALLFALIALFDRMLCPQRHQK